MTIIKTQANWFPLLSVMKLTEAKLSYRKQELQVSFQTFGN